MKQCILFVYTTRRLESIFHYQTGCITELHQVWWGKNKIMCGENVYTLTLSCLPFFLSVRLIANWQRYA